MITYAKHLLTAALFALLGTGYVIAQGFTEPDVLFYGEVRKSGGGQTVLLQSGHLTMTFVNQSNPANRVTVEGELYPVGSGAIKGYSYAIKVPLAYLPEAPRMGSFLSVTTQPTSFKIEEITIDGTPATLPDGSKEFYGLSFASRSGEYRLDLLVSGDSISSAHDGIPDWWKRIFGLDTTIDVAGADPDEDGWNNLEEFKRGSDPGKDNREPQLVTAGIRIPESGQGGVFLQFLDSDTPEQGIVVVISAHPASGFAVILDGTTLPAQSGTSLQLTDLKAGRLSIKHIDRAVRKASLPVSWHDGGEVFSGGVEITVAAPSVEDGSDAALWLNGSDLPAAGNRVGAWLDRSGNGRSAMQPVTEYQPLAGDRALDFSGDKSAHLFFQDAALALGDHTVLAAYRAAATSDEPQTLLSTNRALLNLAPTTQAVSYPGAPTYQVDDVAVRGFENAAGVTAASIFRRKGSLVQNIFGGSYSGENVATAEADPVLPTLGARRLAIPTDGSPVDRSFAGVIHEVLIYPTALAEQKLRDVHDYLQSKWTGAVVWNLSTELKPVVLSAGTLAQRRLIRGGFAKDRLTGGPGDDVIAGGAGDDELIGGAGSDRFLFGGLDTGRKTIADFDSTRDILDLSALYWGVTGDARQYISVRLDTDYSTGVPVIDSALIIKLPSGATQEIVLKGTVVGPTQLIQMIIEGRICMGALAIPTTVQVSLVSGSGTTPVSESMAQSFALKLTRSGAGTSAALDVPLGFFNQGGGGMYVVDGANSSGGQRTVVSFPRGVTTKTVTVHSVPDLETAGPASLQVAVLPRYQYSVSGAPVTQAITDNPMVWLEVVEANAVATPPQPARLIIHRDGDLAQNLIVDLRVGGTAVNGVHVQQFPESITLMSGASEYELLISAQGTELLAGPKVMFVQVASRDRYVAGSPHEALLYIGNTANDAAGAGFNRWVQSRTGGAINGLEALMKGSPGRFADYILAYGLGLDSVDDLWKKGVVLRVVDEQPELTIPSELKAADLRWSIQASNDLSQWADAGNAFVQVPVASGLRFVGPALSSASRSKFYRVNMNLEPGPTAAGGIDMLTGAARYGMSGGGTWTTDPATGALVCSGGDPGGTSRVVARVSGPASINFEMAIKSAGGADALVFYVDGIRHSSTSGATVTVQRAFSDSSSHLLMWEFTRGTGRAVIRNLIP